MKINFKCVNKKFNNLNNFNKQIICLENENYQFYLVSINFERYIVYFFLITIKKIQVRVDGLQHLTLRVTIRDGIMFKNFMK